MTGEGGKITAQAARNRDIEDRRALLRRVFVDGVDGRAALAEITRYCGAGRNPFRPDSDRLTAFECGKLAVAVWLRAQILETAATEDETNG